MNGLFIGQGRVELGVPFPSVALSVTLYYACRFDIKALLW